MSLVRIVGVGSSGDVELVGGPPLGVVPDGETSGLQDDSDATWAELVQPAEGSAASAVAQLDTDAPTPPLALSLTIRARYNPAGTSLAPGEDPVLSVILGRVDADFNNTSLGTLLTLTSSVQEWTFDLATVLAEDPSTLTWERFPEDLTFAGFVAGYWIPADPPSYSRINVGTGAGFASAVQFEVFEAYLTATFEGGVVEEIRVTRQFPRDDAYGLGSAPRIHPPPRRGRIVGGQT